MLKALAFRHKNRVWTKMILFAFVFSLIEAKDICMAPPADASTTSTCTTFVYNLYFDALGRQRKDISQAEMQPWVDLCVSGQETMAQITTDFYNSAEYLAGHPPPGSIITPSGIGQTSYISNGPGGVVVTKEGDPTEYILCTLSTANDDATLADQLLQAGVPAPPLLLTTALAHTHGVTVSVDGVTGSGIPTSQEAIESNDHIIHVDKLPPTAAASETMLHHTPPSPQTRP